MRGRRTAADGRPFDCALGKRALASGGLAGTNCRGTEGDTVAMCRAPVTHVRANTVLPVFCSVFWCINRRFKPLMLLMGASGAENLSVRGNYNIRCKLGILGGCGQMTVGTGVTGKRNAAECYEKLPNDWKKTKDLRLRVCVIAKRNSCRRAYDNSKARTLC
jgi:hypothetical protein